MDGSFGGPQTKTANRQHVPQPPFTPLLGPALSVPNPAPLFGLQAWLPLSSCLMHGEAELLLAEQEILLVRPLPLVKSVALCLMGVGLTGPSFHASTWP